MWPRHEHSLKYPLRNLHGFCLSLPEGKGFFQLAVPHHSPSLKEIRAGAWAGSGSGDLEAGTDAEAVEECCLLAGSLVPP